MANEPNHGTVVPFDRKAPNTITIKAHLQSVGTLNQAYQVACQAKPQAANTNLLGDLAPHPMNETVATAYRVGSSDFVNTMLRDIMTENDAYTAYGSAEIDWLMANFLFGLSTSVRDWIGVRMGTETNEYAAADNYNEIIANYFMIAQSKRGV